jgi:hypothetical protein
MYLINANAYNLIKSGDFKMKYYLYDIPFAKYSIIRNINQINEEPENYLNMFDQLIYKLKTDLIETNLTDFSNLENFNFKFNYYYYSQDEHFYNERVTFIREKK